MNMLVLYHPPFRNPHYGNYLLERVRSRYWLADFTQLGESDDITF